MLLPDKDPIHHRQPTPGMFRTWKEALLALVIPTAAIVTVTVCVLACRWRAIGPWAVAALAIWAGAMIAAALARQTSRGNRP